MLLDVDYTVDGVAGLLGPAAYAALVRGEIVPGLRATSGASPLETLTRLFDVYTGPQVGEGHKSLAFSLRLRAADRTLTASESAAVRDAIVAEAHRRFGASLRA